MRSLHLIHSAPQPGLAEQDLPKPNPASGEVLIRVRATGITPTEVLWYPTSHTRTGEPRTEAVLSHEFSGEIAALGDAVTGLSVGDQVYGMNDWFANGALAEYCLTQPDWIAPKPRSLDHAESASVPIGALTAWQGLFDRATLQAGERVLIHGGAGAVGVYALQLAHARGAHVITTVSARNLDFARELGADEALDYKTRPFEEEVHDIDVVFDAVGGETLQRSWSVLKRGGRLVTVAAAGEATQDERTKSAFFIVEPRRDQLIELAARIDAGELRPIVDTVLPWSMAAEAYTGQAAKRGRGKLVVTV